MCIKYSEILAWKDWHITLFNLISHGQKGFGWVSLIMDCDVTLICHSQALGLHFLIWKNNVIALFYPEPFLTSHLIQEARGRVSEFKLVLWGQMVSDFIRCFGYCFASTLALFSRHYEQETCVLVSISVYLYSSPPLPPRPLPFWHSHWFSLPFSTCC